MINQIRDRIIKIIAQKDENQNLLDLKEKWLPGCETEGDYKIIVRYYTPDIFEEDDWDWIFDE